MIYINTLRKENRKKSYIANIMLSWECFKLDKKKKIPFIRERKSENIVESDEYSGLINKEHWIKDDIKKLLSIKF